MANPLKIALLCPEEQIQLLEPNDIIAHLHIAISRLSQIDSNFELLAFNQISRLNFAIYDRILIVQKVDLNKYLGDLKTEDLKKIFVIVPDENTEAINLKFEIKQYCFFDIDPENGIKRLYRESDPSTSVLYWSGILDIAFDMISSYQVLTSNGTVFIAETTPDLYQYRNAICSELNHRGFNILPKQFFTGTNEEITATISKYLEISLMSVHLVGSHYGKVIQGGDASIVELQCRLAAKKWRLSSQQSQNFHRIIWLQPGIKANEDRQQRFFDTLRVEDKNEASEVLQVPLEDLKAVLRNKISEITQTTSTANDNRKSIYLIFEPKDYNKTLDINAFFESKGFHVLTIDKNTPSENIVSAHLENLTKANAALIIDMESSPTWIKSKIKDLIKAPGYGRKEVFSAKGLITRNASKYKSLADSNATLLIQGDVSQKESFQDYLKKLNLES